VADLLEDFFAQQQREAAGDPGLKAKFMAYMAAQANTSYSVVDNQLSWVLWLYSMIWMPLLVVMCFMRASRSAQPRGGSSSSSSGKAVPVVSHQQGLLRSASTASTPRAALSAASSGLLLPSESIGGAEWQQQELLGPAAAAQQQRHSSGGGPEAAAGRGLRRFASVAPQQQQQRRISRSDSLGSPHGLPPSASLPAHVLLATGSSSSDLKGSSGGSSSKLGTYRLAASAAESDMHADDRLAVDQLCRQRGSTALR
jgi:hypothetical protein